MNKNIIIILALLVFNLGVNSAGIASNTHSGKPDSKQLNPALIANGPDSLPKTGNSVQCPTPTVSVSSAVKVCSGVPATLSSVGSPTGGTYLWQPGNNSAQAISVTPTTTTLYTVFYTTACGTVSDTVSVIVSPVPQLTITSGITTGCPPFCAQFVGRNVAANVTISSWEWTFGDGSSAAVESPTHCYNNPGVYSIVLSAQSTQGCGSTYSIPNMITVYSIPQANFGYSPNPVTIDAPTVSFSDSSTGPYKIINWFWTFGDGGDTVLSEENPKHIYSDTGTYCPRLEVEDIHGCVDSLRQCFHINSVYSFYIPTAFSPNGDGKNDIFLPQGTDVRSFDMYIYDRWGMPIFHSTNILTGWNGSVNNSGTICMEDTYAYIINVTDIHNKSYKYSGAIYLVK